MNDELKFETQYLDKSSIEIHFSDEDRRLFISAIMLHALISNGSKSNTVSKDATDLAWHLMEQVKKASWE